MQTCCIPPAETVCQSGICEDWEVGDGRFLTVSSGWVGVGFGGLIKKKTS